VKKEAAGLKNLVKYPKVGLTSLFSKSDRTIIRAVWYCRECHLYQRFMPWSRI